jgi:hypothetical protein
MATIKKFQDAPFPVKPSKKLLDTKEISKNYGKDYGKDLNKKSSPNSRPSFPIYRKGNAKPEILPYYPGKDKGPETLPGKLGKFRDEMMMMKKGGSVKKKMKNGGSLSALSASNKRDKGIDPKGAFTKVQKKTLAGARGKASLTKDKQLGATKMAKRGMSIKKK